MDRYRRRLDLLKGQVDFSDFLSFIQKQADRLNNRFGQELRSALPQQEKERRHGNKEKQELTLKATTLATQSKGNGKAASTGSASLKCSVFWTSCDLAVRDF